MNYKDEIQKRQNSDDMLNCQYAARFHFNRAESLGYLAFIISVLSALCIFLPDSEKAIFIAIPIALDIAAIAVQFYFDSIQKTGAKLRNYFDAVVLGINESHYSVEEVKDIKKTVLKTISKNPNKHKLQISNNGFDNPPGVKDWYDLSFDEKCINATFECQKQNYHWTVNLARKRKYISIGTIASIIIICALAIKIFHLSPSKWIPCFIGLTLNQLINAINIYKHSQLMHEIYTISRMPGIEDNSVQIIHLQNKINELRELPVLEINAIHKHYNKKWAEIYKNMIKK